MAFKKGDPRPVNAGRKKGSLNKKKILRAAELLAEKNINPVQEILNILEEDSKKPAKEQMWPATKIGIWLDLLSYCQAKPKEEEPEAPDEDEEDDDLIDVTDSALIEIATGKTGDGE